VPQRVWADVPGNPRGLSDALHHPVLVTSVDGVASERAQDQSSARAFAAACL
jgi:hypothetical protein